MLCDMNAAEKQQNGQTFLINSETITWNYHNVSPTRKCANLFIGDTYSSFFTSLCFGVIVRL